MTVRDTVSSHDSRTGAAVSDIINNSQRHDDADDDPDNPGSGSAIDNNDFDLRRATISFFMRFNKKRRIHMH